MDFADFDDYASYAASRMKNQQSAKNAEVTDGSTPNIPLDDVCEAIQRQRVGVMKWVESAGGEARDAMLSEVAGEWIARWLPSCSLRHSLVLYPQFASPTHVAAFRACRCVTATRSCDVP